MLVEGLQGALLAPRGEVFLPWGCFSAVSGVLEKSCLVSAPASNSLSIVTLTNNPAEVRAEQGNKTHSVSELTDSRVGQTFGLLIAAAAESEKPRKKRGLGCWSCYLVMFLGSFAAAWLARMRSAVRVQIKNPSNILCLCFGVQGKRALSLFLTVLSKLSLAAEELPRVWMFFPCLVPDRAVHASLCSPDDITHTSSKPCSPPPRG